MAAGSIYIPDMCRSRIEDNLIACLREFHPGRYSTPRALGFYSAAITVSDATCMREAARTCIRHGATCEQLYETMLQSYLFLGFPRMLKGAECLKNDGFAPVKEARPVAPVDENPDEWRRRGERLCRWVYGDKYDALKRRVEAMAPEVFFWMELEGYGKVLSRPGLDIVDREIAIVACLMVEHRPAQLHSHLRGALNVGAPDRLVLDVVSDLRPLAPDGYTNACAILERLGVA
jgi:4-carboxymuconolactone decarboxylase